MDDTTSPLWLMYRYKSYGETVKPFKNFHFSESEERINCKAQLILPSERIKDYFNQSTAEVLQKDDLLVLLDEFLSLIAT